MGEYPFHVIQEGPYGLFALQKLYHRGIAACVGLVLVVASGVGECATVEDEASPIAGGIGGLRRPLQRGGLCGGMGEVNAKRKQGM